MPISGNLLPVHMTYSATRTLRPVCTPQTYANAIATALAKDFQRAPHGVKRIMACTHASERTVKYWLSGATGPSGAHLVSLAAHSDAVHAALLTLTGRARITTTDDVTKVRQLLSHAIFELDRLTPQLDCPIF